MDGFNLLSVEKDTSKPISAPVDLGIEIIDEEKNSKEEVKQERSGKLFLTFSFLVLFIAIGSFIFLVIYRISLITQVADYSAQLKNISSSIDLKEMQEFQTMDSALKIVNEKLGGHILTSEVMAYVNANIRKSLQLTDYNVGVRPDNVEVVFTAIAPSMKEIAEQTERFFVLKDEGFVKSFSITNTSFEGETKKIKFTMKINFDRSKVNATYVPNVPEQTTQ